MTKAIKQAMQHVMNAVSKDKDREALTTIHIKSSYIEAANGAYLNAVAPLTLADIGGAQDAELGNYKLKSKLNYKDITEFEKVNLPYPNTTSIIPEETDTHKKLLTIGIGKQVLMNMIKDAGDELVFTFWAKDEPFEIQSTIVDKQANSLIYTYSLGMPLFIDKLDNYHNWKPSTKEETNP
jgi:hypothetical protein